MEVVVVVTVRGVSSEVVPVLVVTVREVDGVDIVESEVCPVLTSVSFCVVEVTTVVEGGWTDWDEDVMTTVVGELEVSTWVVFCSGEPPPPMSTTSIRRTPSVRMEPIESKSPLFIRSCRAESDFKH
jgi:hypothetical protein